MNPKTAIVITSISKPDNPVLRAYADKCEKTKLELIVIGDRKSPADFNLPGCQFLSLSQQNELGFTLSTVLPENSYARKNIGYLLAIKNGCEVLVETDDDNLPLDSFWLERSADLTAETTAEPGWQNMYRYFSDEMIWPRGFPLEELNSSQEDRLIKPAQYFSPIQQALADGNPDVDAIFRLTRQLPVTFKKRAPIILAAHSFCPFNSQNTTWFKEAFPLLYIPSTCNFRLCDIWRSFVALPILRVNGWHLSFHEATVVQHRNEHNLLHDFENEIPGYLHNKNIISELYKLPLIKGPDAIAENLRTCYRKLLELDLVKKKELELLDCWINDLRKIRSN